MNREPFIFMKDLTNVEEIKKIDPQDTLGSTELMAQQMEAAWKQVKDLDIPSDLGHINNIVFCGMGASIYGALVVQSLLGSQFPYPTQTITDYHLPDYANENTLVVLTSYSGSTEEVLSCADEALKKGCKMLVLTKGGKLGEFATQNNVPHYIFDGALNPAGVPRLGNGYTILGLIGLLQKAGIVKVDEELIQQGIKTLQENIGAIKDRAMADAPNYVGKIPVIFAAEHLSGNAQILRNQFNETSKAFSAYYLVPDLNHHLMEGLAFPNPTELKFIVLNSPNYSDKIKKRMQLTIDVVKQNKHDITEFMTTGGNKYYDFMEAVAYGSYLTLYLGLLYDQNPAINPWVDWFKEELAK